MIANLFEEVKFFPKYPDKQLQLTAVLVAVRAQESDQGMASAPNQNTSMQRLHHVEMRIIRVLELAGSVMDELANTTGPRTESVANHCREFMQAIKDIQVTLREEIKSACEYRPFEKCDYNARISNEICCKKLEYIIEQLDGMKQTIDQSQDGNLDAKFS